MPFSPIGGKSPSGYSAPKAGGLMGGLETIFDILNRPGAAVRGGIYGGMDQTDDTGILGGALEGLSGQKRYDSTDILAKLGMQGGWGRSALGFGLDIATDPLTYAGGAIGKGVIKGAGALGRGGAALARKTALGSKALDTAGELRNYAGYIFNTGHNLPAEYGGMRRIANANLRGIRGNVAEDMAKMFEGLTPTQRRVVLAAQEAGWARDAAIEAVRAKKTKWLKDLWDEEVRLGLQAPEAELPNYAEHIFRKSDEYAARNRMGRMMSAKLGFAKKRTIPKLEDAVKAGAEADAAIAGFWRGTASKKATISAQHIIDTAKKFGKVADDTGEYGEGFAKLVGGKRPAVLGDSRFFNQMVDMGDGKLVKLKDIGLPEPILRDLYATFIRTPKDSKLPQTLRNAMGALNRTFREGATVLRPGFHMTNLQGNLWNMNLAGMNPVEAALGTLKRSGQLRSGAPVYTDILDASGRVLHKGEDVARAIQHYNISSPQSTFAGSLGEDMVDVLRKKLDKGAAPKLSLYRRYKNMMQHFGSSIEGGSKEALFLNELKKGKSLNEAAQTVNKFLFDYADLTQKERAIRNWLPFYTWSRKNIPLQAEMLLKRPTLYAGIGKGQHAIEDVTASQGKLVNREDRPEWIREEGGVQLPWSKPGEARYLQPYLPYKDLSMLPIPGIGSDPVTFVRDVGSMLTPWAKMPIEVLTNKNLLTGNRLYDEKLGYFSDFQKRKGFPLPLPAFLHHALANINPALPYTIKTATSATNADLGGILASLGVRAPLTDAATVQRDRKKAQTLRKQTISAKKRQRQMLGAYGLPVQDAYDEATMRAIRILNMLNGGEQ